MNNADGIRFDHIKKNAEKIMRTWENVNSHPATGSDTRDPITLADVKALTWKWYVRGGEAQLEKDIDSLTGYADTQEALDTFSKLEVLARTMKEKLLNKPIQ